MSEWTSDELESIAAAEELQLASDPGTDAPPPRTTSTT